jgi:hypothetical protein
MKVFIGWSGDTSKKVALALHAWVPTVIQAVKPYVSSEDIAKGARWATEIGKELQSSNYGIICVTVENANSPWINFEAGALSREIEKSYVTPFLFNLKPSDVQGPLGLFQSVVNEKEDFYKLLSSINARLEPEQRLDKVALYTAFDMWWPKLTTELDKIGKEDVHRSSLQKRDVGAILEELLELTKVQQRELWLRSEKDTQVQKALSEEQAHRLKELIDQVNALARKLDLLSTEVDPFTGLSRSDKYMTFPTVLQSTESAVRARLRAAMEALGEVDAKAASASGTVRGPDAPPTSDQEK